MPFGPYAPKPSLTIRHLVAEVAKQIGVNPPDEIEIIPPDLFGDNDPYRVNSGISFREKPDKTLEPITIIAFAFGIEKLMSRPMLKAIIAHELGHIALNHSLEMAEFSRNREYQADAFAAKHGFGPDLISALQVTRMADDAHDTRPQEYWSHPSWEQREEAMKKAR